MKSYFGINKWMIQSNLPFNPLNSILSVTLHNSWFPRGYWCLFFVPPFAWQSHLLSPLLASHLHIAWYQRYLQGVSLFLFVWAQGRVTGDNKEESSFGVTFYWSDILANRSFLPSPRLDFVHYFCLVQGAVHM